MILVICYVLRTCLDVSSRLVNVVPRCKCLVPGEEFGQELMGLLNHYHFYSIQSSIVLEYCHIELQR
jgi:hypothetical protein